MAERVQKLLAAAGVGSRRKVEELMRKGLVEVNGRVCKPGDKAGPEDTISVEGREVQIPLPGAGGVIAYNKPVGRIVSRSDPRGRPTVFEDLPPLRGSRWVSVGRLDFNTSGLMLFCSDGGLANALARPASGIEREYMARVRGNTGGETVEKLLKGIKIDGGTGRFESVTPARGGDGANRWFKVVVREGRNRFVRRMWESCGCEVNRLIRTRFGPVKLPKNMQPGSCLFIEGQKLKKLCEAAGYLTRSM